MIAQLRVELLVRYQESSPGFAGERSALHDREDTCRSKDPDCQPAERGDPELGTTAPCRTLAPAEDLIPAKRPKTFKVGDHINLAKVKVGDSVTIRQTEAVAITVENDR